MIESPHKLAEFLKEIQRSKSFNEFSEYTFKLFEWLGAEAIFLNTEELNKKYFQCFLISKAQNPISKRILLGDKKKFLEQNYPAAFNNKIRELSLSTKGENIQNIELTVYWKENVDFKIFEIELDLLQPVLTLKMEQLQLNSKINKYEQMLDNSMDVLMLIENKELEYVSPQAFEFLGFNRQEIQHAIASKDIFHPSDKKEIENKISQDDKKQRRFSKREYRVKVKDGNYKWIQWVVRRIFDENGDVLRMILNFRDVTDKKEAEEEIKHQKLFLQEILDRLPVEIYLKDTKGRYIFINQSAADTLGQRPIEILGKSDLDILSKPEALKNVKEDNRVLKGEQLQGINRVKKKGGDFLFLRSKQLVKVDKRNVLLGYSVDITKQKENEEKLLESTEFINKSFQIIPDSIYIFDLTEFSYVFTNDKIFQKLGYSQSDFGKDLRVFFNKILHQDDKSRYFEQLKEVRKGEKELYELEYRIHDKQQNVHWLYSKKTPMKRNANGQTDQFVGLTFDITDQKLREENLIETKEKLQTALNVREEFLSIISHEIRTPLNAILGIANLLGQSMPDDEREEMLKILKNSGENLLLMINDILDFSKIRADQLQFDISTFNIKDLINNICFTYQPQIQEKGLEFEHFFDDDISEFIKGDPLRLNQVLNNLISNAFKFTENGKVTCSARIIKESAEEQVIEFKVSDTGIGIPLDKQHLIFDPFQQVSSSTSKKYGGTGLGLSITKELIEKLGGDIKVESEYGKGTDIYVIMPFEKANTVADKSSKTYKSLMPFEENKFKLLYVEDVSSNRFLMRAYCNRWQLELVDATSGEEALDYFKRDSFDLILMDLQMPDWDGFETLNALKKTGKKIPPVIALSADVSNRVATKIKESGMLDYITKPIQVGILYQKIKYVLKPESKDNNVDHENDLIVKKSVHEKLLSIYGSMDKYSDYIRQVMEEMDEYKNSLIKSVKKEDYKLFDETCHKLIGSIGLFELVELQDNLEVIKHQLKRENENLKSEDILENIRGSIENSKNEIEKGLLEVIRVN